MAITKNGRDWKRLEVAARQDEAATVREIAGRLDLSKGRKYRNACLTAARAGASNSLEALLGVGGGFRFDDGDYYCHYGARKLFDEALASPNPAPLLSVIYHANKKEEIGIALDESLFINKDAPIDVIKGCLENEPDYFERFVKVAGLHPTEDSMDKLKVMLVYTVAAAPNSRRVLNDALVTVAEAGDVEKTKLLLEQQADPSATAAQSLFNAGKGKKKEHKEIVKLLLPLVKPVLCADVLKRLRQRPEKIDDEIIAAIETAAQRGTTSQPTAAAPEKTHTKGYRAVDADTLELNQTLSDGSRKVVYDFVNELIEITVTTKGAAAPGVSHVSFDDIKKEITEDKRRILDDLNHKPRPIKLANRLTTAPA